MGQGFSGGDSNNGVYNSGQNQAVPSTGLVLQTRAPAPSPQQQIQQQTAVRGTAPNTVVAADVSLHDANGNPYSLTNPLPIYITEGGPTGTSTDHLFFNQVTAIASGSTVELLTYTVTAGFNYDLIRICCDGENVAIYEFWVNGVVQDRRHTHFGQGMNTEFNFAVSQSKGFMFPEGTVISVMVTNFRPAVANFSARIQGVLISM